MGARRLDMSEVKEATRDHRAWIKHGVIVKPPHESSHFVLTATDLKVWVQFVPTNEYKFCRWAFPPGVYYVPSVGTEVSVSIPEGEMAADATIVGTLATRDASKFVPGVLVLVHSEVRIGDASAAHTVIRGDVFLPKYDGHTHIADGKVTSGPLSSTIPNPAWPATQLSTPPAPTNETNPRELPGTSGASGSDDVSPNVKVK